MRPIRQRDLEIRLERIPAHPNPDPALEQYRTPPTIAADVLYRALAADDVAGRTVLDLGCGTGMFAAGAALLGASAVTGIDLDPVAVETAKAATAALTLDVEFRTGDAQTIEGAWDTCLMNPPFGAQYGGRKADTPFLLAALRACSVTYALHPENSREHLERLAQKHAWNLRRLSSYEFPIPHQFRFHTREKVLVPVNLYRLSKADHS